MPFNWKRTGFSLSTFTPQPFNYYVDSVNGNDANDGLMPATAKRTLAGLVAIGAPLEGKLIGLARGSTWRETMALPQNGMRFKIYGSGDWPIMSGATLMSMAWTAAPAATPETNQLTNGNMETWTAGPVLGTWSKFEASSSTVGQGAGHAGSFAAKLNVSTSNGNVVISQTISYTANEVLDLSYWHKEPLGGTGGWQLRIATGTDALKYLQVNGTWGLSDPGNQPPTSSVGWTQFTRTGIVMPNSTGTVTLSLKRNGAATGGVAYECWFDDVSLAIPGTPFPANCYQATLAADTWLVRNADLVFHRSTAPTALADGEYFWESSVLYIRDTRGTPTASTEIGARASCITGDGIDDFYIENVRFENCNDRMVRLTDCQNGIVTLCEFDACGREVNNGAIAWLNSNGCEISYCVFSNTHNDAIYMFGSKFARILYNIIGKCDGDTADCIQQDYNTDGTNNNGENAYCLIEGNNCDQRGANSFKGCITLTQGDYTVVRNNICRGGTFSIAINGNYQTAEDNIMLDSGIFGGLRIVKAYSKTGNVYQNNLIAGGLIGIITDFVLEDGESLIGNEKLTDCHFLNNTIVDCTQYAVNFDTPMGGSFLRNVIDCPAVSGNLYRMVALSSGDVWESNYNNLYPQQANFANFNGTSFATLAAWRSGRGIDKFSITSAPVYTDEGAGDYTQTTDSPSYGWGYGGVGYTSTLIFQSDYPGRSLAGMDLQDCTNPTNPNAQSFVLDPATGAAVRFVSRIEVNDTDTKLSGNYRSEVKLTAADELYDFGSQGWTYRFSFLLPTGFVQDADLAEDVLFQVHNTPDATDYSHPSPPFAIVTHGANLRINGRYEPVDPTTQNGIAWTTDLGAWVTDSWYNFTLFIVWRYDNSGQYYLYLNGDLIASRVNLPNAYRDTVGGYAKQGIYKYIWGDSPGVSTQHQRVVYNDVLSIYRGDSRYLGV